jgi:hypothetical protein
MHTGIDCTTGHYTTHHCAGIKAFRCQAVRTGQNKTNKGRKHHGQGAEDRALPPALPAAPRVQSPVLTQTAAGGKHTRNKPPPQAKQARHATGRDSTSGKMKAGAHGTDGTDSHQLAASRQSAGAAGGQAKWERLHAKPEQAELERSGPRDRAVQGGREKGGDETPWQTKRSKGGVHA